MNNKYTKLFIYYLLLTLGLIVSSWIIWSRFIRERIIRDIPDGLFTEYRFWILLYICGIYLYVIKNHLKPKEANAFFLWLSEIFFMPQKTFDHFIKYNVHTKQHYYTLMTKILDFISQFNATQKVVGLYIFEIVPRVILVVFLLIDTFYINKLELFYKVILIGVIPFLFRYFVYSIKDLYSHWIKCLEDTYSYVYIIEKNAEALLYSRYQTNAPHHHIQVTIQKYIEIKYYNMLQNQFEEDFPHEYIGTVYAKEEIYIKYSQAKYKDIRVKLTPEDHNEVRKLFTSLMPMILEYKTTLDSISDAKEHYSLRWSKVVIFSLYFLCWSFILIVSYWVYPIEFEMFKYLCSNIMLYLCIPDDPFTMLYGYSLNENSITIEKLKKICKNVIRKILY